MLRSVPKIAMVTSEAVPFAKTGGLADVCGALPKALVALGAQVALFLPRYSTITQPLRRIGEFYVPYGPGYRATLEQAELDGYTAFFISQDELFNRPNLYGYSDDPYRFGFFARAFVSAISSSGFFPEVVHCHDWQAGLVPAILRHGFLVPPALSDLPVVFTIHNLQYQGLEDRRLLDWARLPQYLFHPEGLEFHGSASCLKAGVVYANQVTTVSPTYAQEIQRSELGYGLEGLLSKTALQGRLRGILNGLDYQEFNPATDQRLYQTYDAHTLEGKRANKRALLKDLGLPAEQDLPVIGMVTRLADQKGLDLFPPVLDQIMELPLRLVLLGTGEDKYHQLFTQVARRFPHKVSLHLKFDAQLAQRIYAAADLFLMPSRFEP
ncbi:MAG: glycogen/starch synthase, partial [Deinococcus sp.]|nr:glycogen/starch synthase [Deinococcus sp.]